ncbi:MAG: AAA family ATPase [Alphaproteobacteria bacterium]
MTRGFLLGKFLPPHLGHVFLCDFAAARVDRLTVLLCSLPGDPIPGDVRLGWMRALVPGARVVHLDRPDVPQRPEDHPDFWAIWRDIVGAFHPEPVDMVFASESYGHRLASEVGARFVPVDPLRQAVPVAGSAILADPFRHWAFVPAPVRPWFVRRVVLFGPESSGKTTLARLLAERLQTTWVPEYARTHTDAFGTAIDEPALAAIVAGHSAASAAARRSANRILVEDTDPVLTAVWAEMLLGRRPDWLTAFDDPADLYLLTGIDVPWDDDGTRYFADAATRARFHRLCEAELQRRGLDYVALEGPADDRLSVALAAIRARFGV